MTFARRLLGRLGLQRESDNSAGRPPFVLAFSDGRGLDWAETVTAESDEGFSAEFIGPAVLRAELHARCFSDSQAVEVSGVIHNEGRETLSGVTGCATLRLFLGLDDTWGDPLIRRWRGARAVPHFFPPCDFESDDRRLLHSSDWTPLSAHGGTDGRSSSHDLPFAVIAGTRGGLAVAIEWSGTWFLSFDQRDPGAREVARYPFSLRFEAGLWGIRLDLRPGDSLPLPMVLLAPYEGDVSEGGNALRRHVRGQVMPRLSGEEVMPLTSFNHCFGLGNNWNDALLRPVVDACATAGLEYFVIDAGWFKNGFRRGIGNWEEIDPQKFPDGIEPFSRYVQERGMRYGTWFEPEFAHLESALFRQHPEWFFPSTPQASDDLAEWVIEPAPSKTELFGPGFRLLDFGLTEVQQYWVDRITAAYEDWGVRWIRWDCNGGLLSCWNATNEPGWAQIRHVQGLYRVLDYILDAFPELVIEQCASGGNRIDLGTVRRGHTFWMNDHTVHTDIVRRLQTRLNQVLPGNYPNSNLCQPRHSFNEYDYLSHGCGPFGYSGLLPEAPAADRRTYAEAVRRFKAYRNLLLGDYSFETADPENRFGRELHRWRDRGEELVIEFNGAAGPGTASVVVS